jgi:electron transfer flavoprotein alpha subunit
LSGLESVAEKGGVPDLTGAQVIVSGGRGLGNPEKFGLVNEFAGVLGGAVGATRAVVDMGWIPYAHQIGQTGKTVRPKLYVAVGISGEIQHKVVMQTSGIVVAINKDPNAPIFQFSDFGIVGDLNQVVPPLIAEIKRRKGLS